MCIWCLRDDAFSEEDWKEMLEERLNQPSLLDRVKRFLHSDKAEEGPSLEEKIAHTLPSRQLYPNGGNR